MTLLLLAVRVGVLVAGDSAGASLVPSVEARLASARDVFVASQQELAQAIQAPAEARAASNVASLIRQAEDAFFAGDLAVAERALAEAEAAHAKDPDAFTTRTRAGLARAAVVMKRGDTAAAEKSVYDALLLDPDAKAEGYPPSFQELLETTRAKLPARVSLKVVTSTPTARVLVDGREAVAGLIAVVPGSHTIAASGPGLRTMKRRVTVTTAATVRIAVPAAIAPELDSALGAWIDSRASDVPPALVDVLEKTQLDRIVVVTVRGNEARAASATRTATVFGGPFAIAQGESAALAAWSVRSLSGVVGSAGTPRNPATPPIARKPLTRRPAFWAVTGAAAIAIAGAAVVASQPPKKDPGTTTITINGVGP